MEGRKLLNALHWALGCRANKGEEKMTLQQIADKLNSMGLTTSIGAQFRPMSVKRLLDRHDKLQKEQEAKGNPEKKQPPFILSQII